MSRLADLYWELMVEEGLMLEPFLERVKQGEFGTFEPAEVIAFLHSVEQSMLENIETKLSEAPLLIESRDEVVEETHEMINRLIEKYAGR